MRLLEKAFQIKGGIEAITAWLGSGGVTETKAVAQSRADICITCPNNVEVGYTTSTAAEFARKILEIKNQASLRVEGEKNLHKCESCGCVLRLLIWEPQSRVSKHMTEKERSELPPHCWKTKP